MTSGQDLKHLHLSQSESAATDLTSYSNSAGCRFRNSSHGLVVNCAHLGLSDVPKDLTEEVSVLDMSFNNLTVFWNDSLQHVPHLVTLNVIRNPLYLIESMALWPLTELQNLILSYGNLKTLSPLLFVKNNHLTKVRLNNNKLIIVPCDALAVLPRLRGVEIQHNRIQKLNFDTCSKWPTLSKIDVSYNEVVELQQEDFLPLQNKTLSYLFLSNNKIKRLPARVFCHLKSVLTMRIESNFFSSFDIQPFSGMDFIDKLSVRAGKIRQLLPPDDQTYEHYPSILNLDMSSNFISNVPPASFWGFSKLKVLHLSRNRISSITRESFCHLQSLLELDISFNRIASLPQKTFACMPGLKKLNMSNNLLQAIFPDSFNDMPSIQEVYLTHNSIKDLNSKRQPWNLETLHSLDISSNVITTIGNEIFIGLINLKELNLSHNQIAVYFSTTAFKDLAKLERLYLKYEKSTFLAGTFTNLNSLLVLDLSNTPIKVSENSIEQFRNLTQLQELQMETAQMKDIDLYDNRKNQSLFAGLCSLRLLRLTNNHLQNLESRVFQNLSKLHFLDMSNSKIIVLSSGIFESLSSLQTLFLGGNQLQKIPEDMFNSLYHLTVISIRDNNLQDLDTNSFAQNPRLNDLHLAGNQITNIKPETVFPMNTSFNLDLSRNPIICSCSLQWFRRWLESNNIELKHANQTKCSETSLNGLAGQPILSFHPEDHCGINIVPIVVLSFSGVLIGMIVVLAYTKRWWLNHKFFLLKLAVVGYNEMAEEFNDVNYYHHLNIMFQESEQEWVDQVMKPGLEERMPHLQNIIFGDVDLHLGMYYINAIFDALDNSFKTVLLLSNESINDAWTMTKLRMALEHINDTGLDKIILIFVEDIEDENMPYLVRLFLSRNKPYMLWTDDEDGQELFWAQFGKSMRANKAINNAIPF
ncbi:protein artichoke-like [Lytechinus variegatus]|uniref:protein artichoke-like n=1 Tax=Lytechinus variegatus TaxID=7654 RepID=UPI001BB12E60|nr:protein artichoke-like [Lytechinus variegatus]